MRITNFILVLAGALGLTACGSNNPYSKLADPPLVQARLHAVTLAADTAAGSERIREAGYTAVRLPGNYRAADSVQASIWGVPEPVAVEVQHFRATRTGAPDLRLLVMPLAARGREAGRSENEDFFRNVLGTDVPAWPLPGGPSDNLRVQAWTYLIPDVLVASRRLRESGIPVIYDPVSITTAYLGTHSTLAIRAPDGTVVQLVQTSTH